MKIFEILGSDWLDTIILIITVLVTIAIYLFQKRNECRNAARIIVMQIEAINQNVDKLIGTLGLDVNNMDIDKFWQSNKIIEKNEWEHYRYLFAKKLKYNEMYAINIYYSNVISVYMQQEQIKHIIAEASKKIALDETKSNPPKSNETKLNEIKSNETKADKTKSKIIIPELFWITISMQYDRIYESRKIIPYEKLKKIAKMK